MYCKSRAAISKVLRPEYARGVMATAQGLMVKNHNEILDNIAQEERRKHKALRRGPSEDPDVADSEPALAGQLPDLRDSSVSDGLDLMHLAGNFLLSCRQVTWRTTCPPIGGGSE
ncbi:hypothetical protein GUITHDRAFT_120062 [Guillardia theta CCMP2712]|uniref:Uncharacterized protein n=1 Tax=Guillardia theta (strain CCMP2712) TaxID=905079 RepID=L1ICB1_GUITC|nr:hypothetical protein GUITHDRAFT_120062 [Guillardia theta CCMP2712]EKX33732.1 hypothetical protein GUITHDRAFT_120062 [Guillardia theta CCMP2712]|eukprot:XP_005820712.1 hypothetical protein GUITHDRAFT_120062 [Guillardia theta CCMP2712]